MVSYALPALIAVGLCRHVCAARARGGWAWGRLFAGPLLRRLAALQPEHGGFSGCDSIDRIRVFVAAERGVWDASRGAERFGLSAARGTARRKLGDRLEFEDMGDVPRNAGRCERELGVGGLEKISEWLVRTQLKTAASVYGRAAGRVGVDRSAGGRSGCGRHERCADRAEAIAGGGKHDRRFGGGRERCLLAVGDAECGTAACRRFVGDGGGCRSTGAVRTSARMPLRRWLCGAIRLAGTHALRCAFNESGGRASPRATKAIGRLIRYLERTQEPDGRWVPLWFGHQEAVDGRNPVVGTARVVDALRKLETGNGKPGDIAPMLRKGEAWLVNAQTGGGRVGHGARGNGGGNGSGGHRTHRRPAWRAMRRCGAGVHG